MAASRCRTLPGRRQPAACVGPPLHSPAATDHPPLITLPCRAAGVVPESQEARQGAPERSQRSGSMRQGRGDWYQASLQWEEEVKIRRALGYNPSY
jgi:hypothetical protein